MRKLNETGPFWLISGSWILDLESWDLGILGSWILNLELGCPAVTGLILPVAFISFIITVRKEFNDITQITDKNTKSLTKYLKSMIKIINMLENFYITYLRNIKKNLIA